MRYQSPSPQHLVVPAVVSHDMLWFGVGNAHVWSLIGFPIVGRAPNRHRRRVAQPVTSHGHGAAGRFLADLPPRKVSSFRALYALSCSRASAAASTRSWTPILASGSHSRSERVEPSRPDRSASPGSGGCNKTKRADRGRQAQRAPITFRAASLRSFASILARITDT
jgi:hypothetical protein